VNSSSPAVQINDLHKSFGDVKAVAGLSFEAQVGQITAVLGPNGAGKTTTLEICEGHQAADSGLVTVLGLDPRAQSKQLRPRVGVMLQQGGMPASVNADTLLRHVASLYRSPLPIDPLSERLAISGLGRTPIRRLSGGEQRRVAFALAIIGRPEMVILDEPTTGLDPQSRAVVWQTVEELRASGVSVLVTSHLLDEIERVADRVVIVDHGRVVATGSPKQLTGDATQVAVVRSEGSLDSKALGAHLGSTLMVTDLAPSQYLISGSVDAQTATAVTEWCSSHDVALREVSVRNRTLDDVFLELTGREIR
jgi:ABC-2 type transport system ATP-binding protein